MIFESLKHAFFRDDKLLWRPTWTSAEVVEPFLSQCDSLTDSGDSKGFRDWTDVIGVLDRLITDLELDWLASENIEGR